LYDNAHLSKIQHAPLGESNEAGPSRVKIVVPKRGEKDFEPLAETVKLQEMMLQRSREALFNALLGVRGGNRYDCW
jgi:tRNA-splicing endonuclease subunit Sen54